MKWNKTEDTPPPHGVLVLLKSVEKRQDIKLDYEFYVGYRDYESDEVLDQFGNVTLPFSFYQDYEFWAEIE